MKYFLIITTALVLSPAFTANASERDEIYAAMQRLDSARQAQAADINSMRAQIDSLGSVIRLVKAAGQENIWQKAIGVLRADIGRRMDNHEGRLKTAEANQDILKLSVGLALARTDTLRTDLNATNATVASIQAAFNSKNADNQAIIQTLVYHADWNKLNSSKDQQKFQNAIDEEKAKLTAGQ